MKQIIELFTPNRTWNNKALSFAIFGWIAIMCVFWFTRSALIPRPLEVLQAFPDLWGRGLAVELFTSICLNIEALAFTAVISLALSYLTVLPWMRPLAGAVLKLRFLGLTGLTLFFTLATSSGHQMKLAVLVFGMTAYFVSSMADVVANIPKVNFDYARTMRSSEWRVVWEVVIRGTRDQAFDVMRQNAAIGWMMLTMVESLVKSEGGIGTMLVIADRHKSMAPILAIQIIVLAVGLTNDFLIVRLKKLLCPYAFIKLERK